MSCLAAATLTWCFSLLLLNARTGSCVSQTSTESDLQALLAIKSQLHDPLGVTASWNHSTNLCQWRGVGCGQRHRRVTRLDLRSNGIGGFLSPFVGNLSFLRVIVLANNSFRSELPNELGRLSRLETLVLNYNSFSGEIPSNLSRCSNLINLSFHANNLSGEIPASTGSSWPKLEYLNLNGNRFTGSLPLSIGNISTLQQFQIGGNQLSGKIPESFGGQLRSLNYLVLAENDFSGMIPRSIFNISSMETVSLLTNRFEGSLPLSIGFNLPKLKILVVGQNKLTGSIPRSFSNASNLEVLNLSENNLSGEVGIDFRNLPNLTRLNLGWNSLGAGRVSSDLDFITLLTNCTKLKTLGLNANRFGGVLPHSIANLSTNITIIALGNNQICGTIPPEIKNLVNLNAFGIESNQLTGSIPYNIGELKSLQALDLSDNQLHGIIPDSFGKLTLLTQLLLGSNKLLGNIPSSIGNCKNLMLLNISNNKLTGVLQPQILSITTLSLLLDISNNLLSGNIPLEVGNLKNLVQLDLSRNHFSGEIPTTLGECTNLEHLNLQDNSLNGGIPLSLNNLKSIKKLDLSSNNLSGQIPIYLENLSFLEYLNLSYNHIESEVPRKGVFTNRTRFSLAGNTGRLCGGIDELHLPACQSHRPKRSASTILKVVIPVIGSAFILSVCLVVVHINRRRRLAHKSSSPSMLSMEQQFPTVPYAELSKATSEFSSSNIIGQGSFGCVYKGNLIEDGRPVAVKVINLKQKGATKSFVAECEALRNTRHRNLIKIVTVCSSIDLKGDDFKAIVYEYMQYGSLEDFLHQNQRSDQLGLGNLNLIERLTLVIDVASAIEYLHHHCQPPIVHGDLKPSNVLLDHDLVAHVSDFGLARFLDFNSPQDQSSTIGIKGTVGYIAPEYGMGGNISSAGDVYSFGILLLEIFTKRRPTDDMFTDRLTLHRFANVALPERVTEIVDPSVLDLQLGGMASDSRFPGNGLRERIEECLVTILRIGVICSMDSPSERMAMTEVVAELSAARKTFLGRRV